MRLRVALFALSIGFTLIVSSFAVPAQRKRRPAKPRAAAPAPIVSEINTQALIALLRRESDKPLLVNFWATWCDPCRDEFPDLVKINADYKSQGLEFVTVSLDDLTDIKTEVPKFLQRMNATMPAYLLNAADPEPAITAVDPKWQGDLPATILYSTKGEVAYKHFGRVNPGELRQAIERLLGSGRGQ